MSTSPTSTDVKSFTDLGVSAPIVDALTAGGITSPFPIQELTLPMGLGGADVIGQARTGTGKTLAFGVPLLQHVDPQASSPRALVIVPTRELCLQVHDDLVTAGANLDTKIVAVYGGKAMEPQIEALQQGATIVVGTPGRLLDLHRRGVLELSKVNRLVLDEADEMLDLGFLPDVEQLIQACEEDRQTLLFSATMPSEVVALARRYMDKPTFLRADVEEVRIAPETEQHFLSCHRMDKPAVVARILQSPNRGLCVVFTRTKRMADMLASDLRDRGIDASPIHSDLRQEAREKALRRFREGKVDVLVATEVAARGLDISDVTHVVNYDCPDDEKMYLHRIGRTGRAGAAGVAVTLAVWNELARLEMIKRSLDVDAPTHEVFSTSPVLDELFGLPEGESKPVRTITSADVTAAKKQGGRSQKGSGRGKDIADAGSRAPTSAGAEPAAKEAASTDSGQSDGRSRPRRRTRSRGSDAPAGAEAPQEAATPERSAPVESDDSDNAGAARVRKRTRTRVTSGDGDAPGDAANTDRDTSRSPDRPMPAGHEERGGRRRTRSRSRDPQRADRRNDGAGSAHKETSRDKADSATGAGGDTSRRKAGGAGNKDAPRGGKSSTSGGSDKQPGGARRSRGRRGGRSNREGQDRSKSEGPTVTDRESVGVARGEGKPGLNRPLQIQHLP